MFDKNNKAHTHTHTQAHTRTHTSLQTAFCTIRNSPFSVIFDHDQKTNIRPHHCDEHTSCQPLHVSPPPSKLIVHANNARRYLYVCMYVCMYVYIVYMHVYIYICHCVHACIYIYIYIYMYVCMYKYVCRKTHARADTDACFVCVSHIHA